MPNVYTLSLACRVTSTQASSTAANISTCVTNASGHANPTVRAGHSGLCTGSEEGLWRCDKASAITANIALKGDP